MAAADCRPRCVRQIGAGGGKCALIYKLQNWNLMNCLLGLEFFESKKKKKNQKKKQKKKQQKNKKINNEMMGGGGERKKERKKGKEDGEREKINSQIGL